MTQLSAYVGAVLNYLTIGVVLFGGLFGDLTPSDVSVLISQVGCARGVWAFIVVVSFTVDFFCCPFSIPLFCYTAVVLRKPVMWFAQLGFVFPTWNATSLSDILFCALN